MANSYPLPPRLQAILQDIPLEELAFVRRPRSAPAMTAGRKVRQQGFIHAPRFVRVGDGRRQG